MFNIEHPRHEIRASVTALVVQLTIATRRDRERSVCRFCVMPFKPFTLEDNFFGNQINPAFLGNHSKIAYVSWTAHTSKNFKLFSRIGRCNLVFSIDRQVQHPSTEVLQLWTLLI